MRPIAPSMRAVIGVATLLVLGAGAPLMLLPTRTEDRFVFPIDPALTAAFIGANYWAAVVIEGWSTIRRRWVDARAALFGIFVFSTLTGVVSIANRGQFDVSSPFTWIWMGVYTLFPVAMVAAWLRQRGVKGDDEPRSHLPLGLRATLGVITIALLAAGAGLTLYPIQASAMWPWELTTANAAYRTAGGTSVEPYIGCWLVGVGLVTGGALIENDAYRTRPIFGGMAALLALQIVAFARFGADVDWSRPQAWSLAAMLLLIGASGVWGLLVSRSGAP